MLAAKYIVQSYVGITLAAYILGILVNKEKVLWPSEIGSAYPSRPLFQIGIACSTLPHACYIFLWWLKLRSRVLSVYGVLKFIFFILTVYITRLDNAHVHGFVGFLHTVIDGFWMLTISVLARKPGKTVSYRKILGIAYLLLFCLSLHQLSRALTTGLGFEEFKTLRALLLLISLWFDHLCRDEFRGIDLTIDWAPSYSV